jgi:uncharacterized protein with HEPN domain
VRPLTQPEDWRVRIDDMLDAARKIQAYTLGMTRDAFEVDDRTRDAVIRNLIVIGEAARHVPADVAARHASLPLIDIRGMRNLIVHQYDDIDTSIIWDTVQHDIAPLIATLTSILERESS